VEPKALAYHRPSGPVYFPNLNGLRFVAALLVIVHHIEQQQLYLGRATYYKVPAVQRIGDEGVTLFFVLSGFLITYLLLLEQEQFGQVAVGKFYGRRALRIWPLYYAVVLLGLLVVLYDAGQNATAINHWFEKAALYAFFLPNAAVVLYGGLPYAVQAWSIGTEEQFYLIWPWLVRWAGRRILSAVGGVLLVLLLAKRLVVFGFHTAQPDPGPVLSFAFNFLYYFRLEGLVIGAVPAVLLFQRRDAVLRRLIARPVQWLVLLVVISLLAWGQQFSLHEEVYATLFAVLILNLAAAQRPIIRLEARWLDYLGKLSYGLYMLHPIVIALVLHFFGPWADTQVSWLRWLLTLLATLGLSVLLAMLSYHGLEQPFMRRKARLARV